MGNQEITLDNLKRLLRESSGVEDSGQLGGDVLDTEFEDLGYDSLALLETGGLIQREYGIRLDDDVLSGARTPRALLQAVNDHLAQARPTS